MSAARQAGQEISGAEAELPRVSLWQQIAINLFWFANNIHWNALLALIIPTMVATQLPFEDKGLNLALVLAPGTVVAFLINPLTGALSDYARFKMGRRRPFMLIGTALNVVMLLAMGVLSLRADGTLSVATVLVGFMVLFALLQAANNFANSPWSAIIADLVPEKQRGSASGFYGLMTLLGTAVGVELAAALVHTNANPGEQPPNTLAFRQSLLLVFVVLAVIQVVFVAITVVSVKEHPLTEPKPFSWKVFLARFNLEPRKYPDFSWVLLTRLLIMTGIWAINFFLLYYFQDVLGITGEGHGASAFGIITVGTPQQAQAVFLPVVLVAAALTVYFAGWLSDKVGRKKLVYLSGAMMTAVALIFIFAQSFPAALVAALFFGLGFGAYTSVDWALATDVLPPTDEAGKNMGIWSAAGIIPQVVGVVLGGTLTFTLQKLPNHIGYDALFGVTVVLFLLGTLLVKQVKGAR
ncbi:MAG: putative MFS-type transporter [Ktedonobacterales bacterium]|jgi:MFS family permease|nr:MAG: putative MFS-type transporter [Ktedonobacterales bacterium]